MSPLVFDGGWIRVEDHLKVLAASRAEVGRLEKALRAVRGSFCTIGKAMNDRDINPPWVKMLALNALATIDAALSAQPAPCPHTILIEFFDGGGKSRGMFCDTCLVRVKSGKPAPEKPDEPHPAYPCGCTDMKGCGQFGPIISHIPVAPEKPAKEKKA